MRMEYYKFDPFTAMREFYGETVRCDKPVNNKILVADNIPFRKIDDLPEGIEVYERMSICPHMSSS